MLRPRCGCPAILTVALASLTHTHAAQYLEWREKQYDQRCLLDLFGPPDQDVWAHPPPLDPPHLQAQAPAASAAALRQSLELAEQQGASPERDGTPDLDQVDGKPQQPQPHQQQQGQAQNNGGGKPAPAAAAPPPAVDPLLFSEEMKQFAPPGDWDKLRAEDLLDQPAEEQAPAGPVPGTRVLLRSVLCYVASSDLRCAACALSGGAAPCGALRWRRGRSWARRHAASALPASGSLRAAPFRPLHSCKSGLRPGERAPRA